MLVRALAASAAMVVALTAAPTAAFAYPPEQCPVVPRAMHRAPVCDDDPPWPDPDPTPQPPTADPNFLVRTYAPWARGQIDDHASVSFGWSAGSRYRVEGALGRIAPTGGPGSHAVYQCKLGVGGEYFSSTDPNCEGYLRETTLGYARDVQEPGTHPIYRCWQNAGHDHFDSVDPACEGHRTEGILGYFTW